MAAVAGRAEGPAKVLLGQDFRPQRPQPSLEHADNPTKEALTMAMTRPHDPTDLMLAPVALAIDDRLQELAALDPRELGRRILWETDLQPHSVEGARRAILEDLMYLVPTRGWELSWDDRGIRLQHRDHTLVLGIPDNLDAWIASVSAAAVGAA
jgi:hypothetical protein